MSASANGSSAVFECKFRWMDPKTTARTATTTSNAKGTLVANITFFIDFENFKRNEFPLVKYS